MDIESREFPIVQIRFSVKKNGDEVGRASLVIASNDQHEGPFGLLEDVFVLENVRGEGIGNALVQKVIQEARERGCYKLIATSRFGREQIHDWYSRLGFTSHGVEFRLDL